MAIEIGRVRQNSYENYSEGQERQARLNRRGELVVADFWLQMALDGRMFVVNLGTEDAPLDTTTSIDDQLVWALTDVPTGSVLIPCQAQVAIGTWTTSTLINFMLEADMGKVRYTSGGTAFTPANMRGDYPRASACSSYVGTDVTVAAKSTIGSSGSFEFHHYSIEDNGGDTGDTTPENGLNGRAKDMGAAPIITGVGSFLFHLGAATADATAYGMYSFAELPLESVT